VSHAAMDELTEKRGDLVARLRELKTVLIKMVHDTSAGDQVIAIFCEDQVTYP
jgi:hypothetical protein